MRKYCDPRGLSRLGKNLEDVIKEWKEEEC